MFIFRWKDYVKIFSIEESILNCFLLMLFTGSLLEIAMIYFVSGLMLSFLVIDDLVIGK